MRSRTAGTKHGQPSAWPGHHLERYYREQRQAWKNGEDEAQYLEYAALESEVGQVEALRQLMAKADAVDLSDPSSVRLRK
jgi:hypothetical protein